MGDISAHYSRYEFTCKCGCGLDTVDAVLITHILEPVHTFVSAKYGSPARVVITSGNRCAAHNAKIGGAPDSMHIHCKAADFKAYHKSQESGGWVQVDPSEIADFLEGIYKTKFGIGRYHNRTHADSRDKPARWNG